MKVMVTQENLSKGLAVVARIASSRSSLPILANVLLRAEAGQLFITATNLDIAIREIIGAKVSKEGTITVPARLLQDYVSSLPSGPLEITTEAQQMKHATNNHTSTIKGILTDDFQTWTSVEAGREV